MTLAYVLASFFAHTCAIHANCADHVPGLRDVVDVFSQECVSERCTYARCLLRALWSVAPPTLARILATGLLEIAPPSLVL